jgi:hypothetical protein
MKKTMMCLIVVAGIMYLKAAPQSSTQTVTPHLYTHDFLEPIQAKAGPGCQACRDNCVQRRENCKYQACSDAGGANKAVQCENVGDQNKFIEGLKKCESAERDCWARCDASACR